MSKREKVKKPKVLDLDGEGASTSEAKKAVVEARRLCWGPFNLCEDLEE